MLAAGSAAAAAEPSLFDTDEVLEARLSGPFEAMFANKSDHSPRPFTLSSKGMRFPIEASLHGYSRLRVCNFPPMLLRFPPAAPGQQAFTTAAALRLVTHCRNNDEGEQNLLEEYAAHRIFNLLSEASYRVRLLRISYEDTGSGSRDDPVTRYAFLLEPHEQLEARIGATRVELNALPKRRNDPQQAALIYVFQYLIANTDWGFVQADSEAACCHNGIVFERDSQLMVVPYDFDLSGLVNARYAYPDRSLPIRKVTQRWYRGYCTDRAVLRMALEKVQGHRADILALLGNLPGLSPKSLARDTRFLEDFFKQAEHPERLLDKFEKRCL